MSQRTTRARVLGKLLESLGTAKTGSRELDIVVAYVLGDTSSEAGRMIQLLVGEGYSWDIVSELLDEDLAAYTTSLDAAVPGEHIVLSLFSRRRQRWAAVQAGATDSDPPGAEALSWAATECLARRRAALRALYGRHARETQNEAQSEAQSEVQRGARGEAPAAPSSPSGRAPRPGAAPGPSAARAAAATEGGDAAAEEWKILF